MASTAFLIVTGALVACNLAARITVASGRFDDLPRPIKLD